MPLVDEGLELLSDAECRGLLRSVSVGRIGVSVNALPVIMPVDYRLMGDAIRFWNGPSLKLHAAQTHTVVAFEVDDFDQESHGGWSVLAVGLATEVDDAGAADAAVRDGFRQERSRLIEVTIEFLSGRRIVTAGAGRPICAAVVRG